MIRDEQLRWTIVGIVSTGPAECGVTPVIYHNVITSIPWILQTLQYSWPRAFLAYNPNVSVNQWEDKIFIIFYHWKTKKLILCIFYLNLIQGRGGQVDEFQAFNWSVNPNSMGVWLWPCKCTRKADKLNTTKCKHSHWSTGYSTHLWLADKSQTNLWAFLSSVPWATYNSAWGLALVEVV